MLAERLVEPDCPLCEGLGFVQRIGPDGLKYAKKCECVGRRKADWLLSRSGVPDRYAACTLVEFEVTDRDPGAGAQKHAARRAADGYIERFETALSYGRLPFDGLLFVGPPGVGKTHLAAALLSELVQRFKVRGYFVDFTHLIHEIQASFDSRVSESRGKILDPVIESDIVVIDELGAQRGTPFVHSMLYEVINSRYTARRPTIFTTNFLLDEKMRTAPVESPGRVVASRHEGFQNVPLGSDADVARMLDKGRQPMSYRAREPEEMPVPSKAPELLSARVGPLILSRLYEMAKIVLLTGVVDHREKNKGQTGRERR